MDSGADWRSIAEVVPISRWRAGKALASRAWQEMLVLLVFGRFVVALAGREINSSV